MRKYRIHLVVALFVAAFSFSSCVPHGGPHGGGGHRSERGRHH